MRIFRSYAHWVPILLGQMISLLALVIHNIYTSHFFPLLDLIKVGIFGLFVLLVTIATTQGIYSKRRNSSPLIQTYHSVSSTQLGILISLSALVAITILVGFEYEVTPNMFPDFLNGEGSSDEAFYVVMSVMRRTQGMATTGLHGLMESQGYYIGGHYIFGWVSQLLFCELSSVLILGNSLVFFPLLLLLVMQVSSTILPGKTLSDWLVRWLLLTLSVGGILTYLGMMPGSLPLNQNNPVSAVNCLGSILLLAYVGFLIRGHYLFAFVSLAAVFFTKTTFGICGMIFLFGLFVLRTYSLKRIASKELLLGTLLFLVFVWWWFVYPDPPTDVTHTSFAFNPGSWASGLPIKLFALAKNFYVSDFVNNVFHLQEFGIIGKLGAVLLMLFSTFVIFSLGYFCTMGTKKAFLEEYRGSILSLAIAAFLFISIDFTGGMHVYLTAPLGTLALPLFVLSSNARLLHGKLWWYGAVPVLVVGIVCFISNTAHFVRDSLEFSPAKYKSQLIQQSLQQPERKLHLLRLFREISRDSQTLDYLIYVSPDDDYWLNCRVGKHMMHIPIFSERPALYGWQSCQSSGHYWDADKYQVWGQGYWWYPREVFDIGSTQQDAHHLCNESVKLGYAGYITFPNEGYVLNTCYSEN